MTNESPVAIIERWTGSGADYRVVQLTDDLAIVELTTCHGEFVERLESSDPALLDYLKTAAKNDG